MGKDCILGKIFKLARACIVFCHVQLHEFRYFGLGLKIAVIVVVLVSGDGLVVEVLDHAHHNEGSRRRPELSKAERFL